MQEKLSGDKILSIDIGGSHIKATILNANGAVYELDHRLVDTPRLPGPKKLVAVLKSLAGQFPEFDKMSVGFPGYVRDGIVYTAPSLAPTKWNKINLQMLLQNEFKCPVKVINDADMQGLGIAKGKGLEMVITLGTGLGSALLLNGDLLPHLEMSQHPFLGDLIFDKYIGKAALEAAGEAAWNKRVKKMLTVFKTVFNYDHLYIGGGNSRRIKIKLEKNVTLVSNKDGIKGGAKLWQHNKPALVKKTTK